MWTLEASPTDQNLNGIAAAGTNTAPMVAVGDAGTVLYSPDGISWTSATSGTSNDLRGVAFGSNASLAPTFVAVGAKGTILTSNDGREWTARASGTTADLNAVVFFDEQGFMAVGSAGTALFSLDGVSWTPAAASGTSADLNAVAYVAGFGDGPGGFVAAGDSGTLLVFPRSGAPLSVATGTAANFTALALQNPNATSVYALGDDGTVEQLQFSFDSGLPAPQTPIPSGAGAFVAATTDGYTLTAGGQVGVVPAGGSPVAQLPASSTYSAIATGPFAVVVGSGGVIWANTATGASASLAGAEISGASGTGTQFAGQDLELGAPTIADASYQWAFQGAPLPGATQSVLSLPALTLAQSGAYTVMITAPGVLAAASVTLAVQPVAGYSPALVDPSFHGHLAEALLGLEPLPNGQVLFGGNTLLNSDGSSVPLPLGILDCDQLIVQPDGKWIMVSGSSNGTRALRYNPDGSVDASFVLGVGVPAEGPGALALLPSGQFVYFQNAGSVLQWWRLNSDGSADPTFAASPSTVPVPRGGLTPVVATDASGRVYASVGNSGLYPATPALVLIRLDAAQNLDPTFSIPPLLFTGASYLTQMLAVPGGLLYQGTTDGAPVEIGLLGEEGAPAAGYAATVLPSGSVACLAADGSAVALIPASSPLSSTAWRLERLTATGLIDPNYGGFLVGDPPSTLPAQEQSDSIFSLAILPNGQLLVDGDFNSMNNVLTQGVARLTPDTQYAQTRLVNVSARGYVTPQQSLTIGGYLNGAGTGLDFLLRGGGPSLAQFGISDALAVPQIQLYAGQTPVASNAGWSGTTAAAQISSLGAALGAYAFPDGSADDALIASLSAGPFTLVLTGSQGSGVALDEAWDADGPPADASALRISNYSCLGTTAPGDSQLTLGFVVAGPDVKQFLVRAVGPGLAPFGVSGVLGEPILTLYQGQNVVAADTGWSNGADVASAAAQVGAFALTPGSADSALLVTLPAGAYTAVASGVNAASGNVLLEVYEVP